MNEIKWLLNEIEEQIKKIKNDSSWNWISEFAYLLIQLSTELWEAKKEFIRLKTQYDISFETKVSDIMSKQEKLNKTAAETQATIELKELKIDRSEAEQSVIYLEIILRSYYEFLNAIKFELREVIKSNSITNKYNEWY